MLGLYFTRFLQNKYKPTQIIIYYNISNIKLYKYKYTVSMKIFYNNSVLKKKNLVLWFQNKLKKISILIVLPHSDMTHKTPIHTASDCLGSHNEDLVFYKSVTANSHALTLDRHKAKCSLQILPLERFYLGPVSLASLQLNFFTFCPLFSFIADKFCFSGSQKIQYLTDISFPTF